MNWTSTPFAAHSLSEFYEILLLRSKVFVVEQHCIYQDLDNKDPEAIHLCGRNENGELLAYCRMFPPGSYFEECCIGRVVTDPGIRGFGFGKRLMEEAIAYIGKSWPGQAIRISGQLYLKKFYESLGFRQVTEVYLEDDIPHIAMLRAADEPANILSIPDPD